MKDESASTENIQAIYGTTKETKKNRQQLHEILKARYCAEDNDNMTDNYCISRNNIRGFTYEIIKGLGF